MDSVISNGYNNHRHRVSDTQYTPFLRVRDYAELLLYSSLFLGLAAVGMVFTSCFIQGILLLCPHRSGYVPDRILRV